MEIKQKDEVKEDVEKEVKRLVNSFKYAGTGVLSALKKERNMKIHYFFVNK